MIDLNNQTWVLSTATSSYQISTQQNLLSHEFVNEAFASDEMSWAKPLPPGQIRLMLQNSVTAGIYEAVPGASPPAKMVDEPISCRDDSTLPNNGSTGLKQVGMARLITDHVTFAYLTDVYIAQSHRGQGLFKLLMACVKEMVAAHPSLRRLCLLTGQESLQSLYRKELGVWLLGEHESFAVMTGNKF
ncbi:hypothetical protein LTR62_007941 [Meristemomyces frigidus]|uniref:N-acetyltransferase domain-containing protein n=1 Tax=Meristemomyces frigidus TaxID=1508187 RepID=A0AAN7TGW9_9PEZI|nr:hypothetical protein LTR62_007941 [Meristemomyces frigidus]